MNIEKLPVFGEKYQAYLHPRDGRAFDINNEGIKHYKSERIELFHKAMQYDKLPEAMKEFVNNGLAKYESAGFAQRISWPAGWYHSVANKHLREYVQKLDEMFEGYIR